MGRSCPCPPFCPLRAAHAAPPEKREGGNRTREIEGPSDGREGGGDPRKWRESVVEEEGGNSGGCHAWETAGRPVTPEAAAPPCPGPSLATWPFLLAGPGARTAPGKLDVRQSARDEAERLHGV